MPAEEARAARCVRSTSRCQSAMAFTRRALAHALRAEYAVCASFEHARDGSAARLFYAEGYAAALRAADVVYVDAIFAAFSLRKTRRARFKMRARYDAAYAATIRRHCLPCHYYDVADFRRLALYALIIRRYARSAAYFDYNMSADAAFSPSPCAPMALPDMTFSFDTLFAYFAYIFAMLFYYATIFLR